MPAIDLGLFGFNYPFTPTDANIIGIVLLMAGAYVAARAVMLTEDQADQIATTRFDGNKDLKDALLSQSRKAKQGLLIVVLGFGFQMFAATWEKAAGIL